MSSPFARRGVPFQINDVYLCSLGEGGGQLIRNGERGMAVAYKSTFLPHVTFGRIKNICCVFDSSSSASCYHQHSEAVWLLKTYLTVKLSVTSYSPTTLHMCSAMAL